MRGTEGEIDAVLTETETARQIGFAAVGHRRHVTSFAAMKEVHSS